MGYIETVSQASKQKLRSQRVLLLYIHCQSSSHHGVPNFCAEIYAWISQEISGAYFILCTFMYFLKTF